MNFFLQDKPALATGRGEIVESLEPFPRCAAQVFFSSIPASASRRRGLIKTSPAFPTAQNGTPGRARKLINLLQAADLAAASREFYNSLEAPALEKYPVLASVSGISPGAGRGRHAHVRQRLDHVRALSRTGGGRGGAGEVQSQIRENCWTAIVPV